MTDLVAVEYCYDVYDVTDVSTGKVLLGQFLSMTGGNMTMSPISYNVINASGLVTTKFIPGQVTYGPVFLSRTLDAISWDLSKWFDKFAAGIIEKKNITIVQLDKDDVNTPLATWDLINAVPIAQPGFSYNSYRGSSSTKYKLTLQAEEIKFAYLPTENPLKKEA
jgi:phage tail-like protein